MKPKTNLLTVGDQFQINGKRYVFLPKVYNTTTKRYNVRFQSLGDNGKRHTMDENEFEDKLNLYKSENVSIFGKCY